MELENTHKRMAKENGKRYWQKRMAKENDVDEMENEPKNVERRCDGKDPIHQ